MFWTGDHEANSDEMEELYIRLKQASLSPIGDRKPSTKKDFRASFIKRCKNNTINDKLHLIRTLNSTLKVKEDISITNITANMTLLWWIFVYLATQIFTVIFSLRHY